MARKMASHRRFGHATGRPRRAINATTARAEPKNRSPATSRSDVACHSVMRAVTDGFVESPTA